MPDKKDFVVAFLKPRLKLLETPDATRENSFNALNALCFELRKEDVRWGLLEKKGGARVRNRASDVLAYSLLDGTCQLYDVIGNSEGADNKPPKPTFREIPADEAGIRPIDQWKLPYGDVEPTPVPDPEPTPEPKPTCRCNELEAKLKDLVIRIALLENRKYKVVGGTSRDMWHAHKIDLPVVIDENE